MPERNTSVRYIKGIGEKRAKSLEKLGIRTLEDLVSYFPRRYEDRSTLSTIAGAEIGASLCVRAMVAAVPRLSRIRGGREILRLRVVDNTGAMDITFFNQSYLKNKFSPGETYIFFGKIDGVPVHKSMVNPLFETPEQHSLATRRIVPIYHLTAGVSQKLMQSAVYQGLSACGGQFPDYLPGAVQARYQLAQARFAYENIHFPRDFEALEIARRRLIFEELFVLACALGQFKGRRRAEGGIPMAVHNLDGFFSSLPFAPTAAQRRAAAEAAADMSGRTPMNRLLQGDVGSGKTLVAAACIWYAAQSGCQSALMAPTEILAEQHYDTLTATLAPLGLRVVKLTGSMPVRERRAVLAALAAGEADLAVGTHALLGEAVSFARLGLVVTDEQHRFGVRQRSALSEKGASPHVLVMSATPIPRTLALMIYGDLDVSVLDELPPGRQKVDTFAVTEAIRPRLNGFIRKQVRAGRQVFVVCPMIAENEELPPDVKSAETYARELQTRDFPDLRVGCVHGRMSARDKEAAMAAFVAGETDILVSTTVIEVGVDIPNANLIVIENAERFGLSQLHQLRGRVGRGPYKSYCILVSNSRSEESRARLKVLCQTADGFKISEADLKLRGPGDFFGARQHGLPELHIADLCTDMNVLTQAQEAAQALLAQDPRLERPENRQLRQHIAALFSIQGDAFN